MQREENIHAGHRQRMRRELIEQDGFDRIEPHRILEVLLFYGIPRKDTNPIAHELLLKFGSLAGVMDADIESLMKVKGMTENAAALIKIIMPLARRYKDEKFKIGHKFDSCNEMGDFLVSKYIARKNECFAITSLDNEGGLLGFDIISEGIPDAVSVDFRDVASTVLRRNASCVIISHNHITKNALPSQEDIATTLSLKNSLESISVRLLDHVIIAGDDYISMRQSENYSIIFK